MQHALTTPVPLVLPAIRRISAATRHQHQLQHRTRNARERFHSDVSVTL